MEKNTPMDKDMRKVQVLSSAPQKQPLTTEAADFLLHGSTRCNRALAGFQQDGLALLACFRGGEFYGSAVIDRATFKWAGRRRWHIDNDGYVRSHHDRLHRLILDAPEGVHVDHINGDKLDNRRCNLRLCTRSENMANRGPNEGREFKGVFKNAKSGWESRVGVGGKSVYLGLYRTPEEAAVAYDVAAKSIHGKFARLNFDADATPSLQEVPRRYHPADLEYLVGREWRRVTEL